jgi:hypothetical protein
MSGREAWTVCGLVAAGAFLMKGLEQTVGAPPLRPWSAIAACLGATGFCTWGAFELILPSAAAPTRRACTATLEVVRVRGLKAFIEEGEPPRCTLRLLPEEARRLAGELLELADFAEIGAPT